MRYNQYNQHKMNKPSTFQPISSLHNGTLTRVRRGKSKKGNPYVAYGVLATLDGVRGEFEIYENMGESSYLTGKQPGLHFQWSISINPVNKFESYRTYPMPGASEPTPPATSPDDIEQVHAEHVEQAAAELSQEPKRFPKNLLKVALKENVIKKHGTWFSFDSLLKANGEKAAVLKLANDTELYDIVKKAVQTAKASAEEAPAETEETVEQEELIK